jgi:hypothetical protein
MNSNIKIMKTLMKIPTTLDEDMESLLLLLSITAQSDALPGQLQQQPCKKSKLARSGNGTTSTAIMDIFLVSQDSIHLEGQWKSSLQICGICGMQWTRCTSLHWRQRRGRQSIVKINRKKLRAKQLPHASDSPFCQFAQITFVGPKYKQTCCEKSREPTILNKTKGYTACCGSISGTKVNRIW